MQVGKSAYAWCSPVQSGKFRYCARPLNAGSSIGGCGGQCWLVGQVSLVTRKFGVPPPGLLFRARHTRMQMVCLALRWALRNSLTDGVKKKTWRKSLSKIAKSSSPSLGPKSGGRAPIKTKWVKVGQKSGKHRGSPERSLANRCNGRNAVGDRSFKAKFALNRLRGADLTGAERWLGLSPRAIPRHVNPTQFKCR